METQLELLEKLLSITEPYKDQMYGSVRKIWQEISAQVADMREAYDEKQAQGTSKQYYVSNIVWDTDDEVCDLPKSVMFFGCPDALSDDDEDAISEMLSDAFGFCHKGFNIELLTDELFESIPDSLVHIQYK